MTTTIPERRAVPRFPRVLVGSQVSDIRNGKAWRHLS
jgi:hypothetical protein